ncbi:MAG: glycosyltransferase [Deltaproteobacteria bacterium]|nr:glycosyltransferase [Deltaproteobacteria bacterium]
MRIAYIATPVDFGGAEKVSLNFLRNVDKNRFDISAILLVRPWEADNAFVKEIQKAGFEIHRVPVATRPSSEGKDFLRVPRCFKLIHSILKRGTFDLVHTHGYFADIVGIPTAKKLSLPVISTCHGFIQQGGKLKLYNRLDLIALRLANKVIAVSEALKQELVAGGIKERRIVVIPNAVMAGSQRRPSKEENALKRRSIACTDDAFIAGYAGRLSKEKGVAYLIEAASMVIASGADIRLVIIGDGPEKDDLTRLAASKGIADRVTLTGFQSDVESWLACMDAFVLPSLTEGTPLALLEAMASGLPCVASAVGGVPQVVANWKDGVLVSPGKPEEIADALDKIYKNPSAREALSIGAMSTINARYNIKDWTKRIEAEYLELGRAR